MRRVRLVIADRRPIVLQGFVSLLEAQPDFEVVACCLDGANCLASIRRLTPDVVLLEDGFTDVTASDILAVVDDEALSSRLVFFTATVACGDLARALATGACGAISMNAQPEALVQSLRLEKPGSDLARVGHEANGIASFGNNVLAVLTVNAAVSLPPATMTETCRLISSAANAGSRSYWPSAQRYSMVRFCPSV